MQKLSTPTGLRIRIPETRRLSRVNARCSTDEQDLTVQREGLAALGVTPDRIYVDHGLTGCNRDRPGLREALAACRDGDTLVVTKLDRLARSLPHARAIADELTTRRVRLSLGGAVYDPTARSAGCCSTCWRWSLNSLLSRHAGVATFPGCGLRPDGLSTGEGGRCAGGQGARGRHRPSRRAGR
jgi:hypothetical protein